MLFSNRITITENNTVSIREPLLVKMVKQVYPSLFIGKSSGRIYRMEDRGSHIVAKL